MSTYIRYFIHYILITSIISIGIGVAIKGNSTGVNRYVLLTYVTGVVFFCAGMSLFISNYSAKNITITKEVKDEQELQIFFEKLNQFIRTETKRQIRSEVSKSYYLYRAQNAYISWLMNKVEVEVSKNAIRIVIPKEYEKSLSKL